jgi:hypothetical protein
VADKPKRLIYLGGPVDYAAVEHMDGWQHQWAWDTDGQYSPYCPRCEGVGLTDEQIINQNHGALMSAHIVILDLRSHSIGTPIEMFWRLWVAEKSAILITRKEPSVYVRFTLDRYPAMAVQTPQQAYEVVETL